MPKSLTPSQSEAARKLALIVCDQGGHSHLPFGSICENSRVIAERFFKSLVTKKLI